MRESKARIKAGQMKDDEGQCFCPECLELMSPEQDLCTRHFAIMDIPSNLAVILRNARVRTFGELSCLTKAELLDVRECGIVRLEAIEGLLAGSGFSLREEQS